MKKTPVSSYPQMPPSAAFDNTSNFTGVPSGIPNQRQVLNNPHGLGALDRTMTTMQQPGDTRRGPVPISSHQTPLAYGDPTSQPPEMAAPIAPNALPQDSWPVFPATMDQMYSDPLALDQSLLLDPEAHITTPYNIAPQVTFSPYSFSDLPAVSMNTLQPMNQAQLVVTDTQAAPEHQFSLMGTMQGSQGRKRGGRGRIIPIQQQKAHLLLSIANLEFPIAGLIFSITDGLYCLAFAQLDESADLQSDAARFRIV